MFFFIFYGGTIMLAFLASLYLLLRRINAFSTEITPSLRLRRWTAGLLASIASSHIWWLLFYFAPANDIFPQSRMLCFTLDILFIQPPLLCTMLVMLQDRRRSLWNVVFFEVLSLIDLVLKFYTGSRFSVACLFSSALFAFCILFFFVRALRQYDRWLLDNYADLEHKEVRNTFYVMAAFLITTFIYGVSSGSLVNEILIEVADIIFFIALVWRVETLPTLDESTEDAAEKRASLKGDMGDPAVRASELPDRVQLKLQQLLKEYCIDAHFYLQHDATLNQLAKRMGTNRYYLSQYFACMGLTYNNFINNLRIDYFISLYKDAQIDKRAVKAIELTGQCGFRSYKTFSSAFKQVMGVTFTEWIHAEGALDDGALDEGALVDGALDKGALNEGALDEGALDEGASTPLSTSPEPENGDGADQQNPCSKAI